MNENNGPVPKAVSPDAIAENQYVKELFEILDGNGRDTSGLSALLSHVSEMEGFVKRAEETIAAMKSQLSDMKEVQNHPVKAMLQSTIKLLERKLAEAKERISYLKDSITESCKSAVRAFKEKWITALDKITSFFNIRSGLLDLNKSICSAIKADDRAVAAIDSFAAEYHRAGRAIKNMARVVIGKPPIDAKKESGKLARALSAPYKTHKAVLARLGKSIDKAVASLDGIETKAAERRGHMQGEHAMPDKSGTYQAGHTLPDKSGIRQAGHTPSEKNVERHVGHAAAVNSGRRQVERAPDKKPSLLGQLHENIALVERNKREAPIHERTALKGAEI